MVSRRRSLLLVAGLIALFICIPEGSRASGSNSAGPEARSGHWNGKTEFGTFSFTVGPDGQQITGFTLNYNMGIVSGSFRPKGQIAMPIAEDGSFDLSVEGLGLVFRGQFTENSRQANGLWEMDIPMAGRVSDEWQINR